MTIPGTVSGALQWQYFDGAAYQNFGAPFDMGSLLRTRRVGLGPRQSQLARVWRLIKRAGTDWDTAIFSADTVRFWTETNQLSAVRVRAFSFDDKDQRYFHVHTYGNIEVYHGDARVASIPSPYDSALTLAFTRTMVLDTLLTFHSAVRTQRITRQGAHDQWDARALTFISLPLFDYNGDRAGGADEVQEIHFQTYVSGDTFDITLEGQVTSSITYSGSNGTTAAAILAALVELSNVGPGGVTVANTGTDTFTVTFVGDNFNEDVGEMGPRSLHTAAGLVYANTVTEGVEGGEDVISDARGWPSCGAFYQNRLYMGGLRSRPQTVLGSLVTNLFKFKTLGTDTNVNEDISTDETTTITAIFPGQHLQLFTSSAEFFFPSEPIISPAGIKRTTDRGIQGGIPPVRLPSGDGQTATLFVTAGGTAVAEFLFVPTFASAGSYSAQLISKFATHLLANPDQNGTPQNMIVDMGFRRAKSSVEADRALLIRDDGLAVVMHALREDDVTGFVRWTTQGQYLSAAADLARDEYIAVLRNGEVLLEKISAAALLDAQVSGGPGTTMLSAPWLAGLTATLYIDGADAGDVLVPGDGAIVLPRPALRQAFAGLLFVPHGITLPAVLEADLRQGLSIEPQLGVIDLKLGPTANLFAGIKGGEMWKVPLTRAGDTPADSGPGENAFSGWTQLIGIPGFRTEAQCEFIQPRPGPLMIKTVVLTIDS